jgi:tight adherence protein C
MGEIVTPVLLGAVALGTSILLLVLALTLGRDTVGRASRANLLGTRSASSGASLLEAPRDPRSGGVLGDLDRLVEARAPASLLQAAAHRLDKAGLAGTIAPGRIVLIKVSSAVVVFLLGLGLTVSGGGSTGLLVALIGTPLSFLVPDVLLGMRASSRQVEVLASLADTLDLMTITVEAGVAFEAAMVRAGRSGRGPLAEELVRTMQEMQAGVPRVEALHNLARRCDVQDLTTFTASVAQAERFGVPIARVLRVQSAELREKRRQRAEEAAMKLPTKVILPLALCILPAMMILVVGPSIVQIGRSFAQL